MGCGCKKKKVAQPAPTTTKKNYTHEQQEALVNEIINKINKTIKKQ